MDSHDSMSEVQKKLGLAIWEATSAEKEDKNGGNGRKQKQGLLLGFLKVCWEGELWDRIKKEILTPNRVSALKLGYAMDMRTNLNYAAIDETRLCQPNIKKYDRGMVPSSSSVKSIHKVLDVAAAEALEPSLPTKWGGEVWVFVIRRKV